MSKDLGKVKGEYESGPHPTQPYESEYAETELHVNWFWGGTRGPCIQLTLSPQTTYIQLNRKQVIKLIRILMKYLWSIT